MAIEPNNDRDRQTHGTSRIDEVDGQTEKKTNWLPWVLAALGTLLLLFTLSRCNRNEAAVVNNTTEYNAADLNATDFNTTDVNTVDPNTTTDLKTTTGLNTAANLDTTVGNTVANTTSDVGNAAANTAATLNTATQ